MMKISPENIDPGKAAVVKVMKKDREIILYIQVSHYDFINCPKKAFCMYYIIQKAYHLVNCRIRKYEIEYLQPLDI
jgi:hypothetical protein